MLIRLSFVCSYICASVNWTKWPSHDAIELRLALARAQLDAGDPKTTLQRAREALDLSMHPECQYAWGEADALHLCGVAHARLGELDLAAPASPPPSRSASSSRIPDLPRPVPNWIGSAPVRSAGFSPFLDSSGEYTFGDREAKK